MQKKGIRIWCKHQVQREVCARILRYLDRENIIESYVRMENSYNVTFLKGRFNEILSTFDLVINKCRSLDGITFIGEDNQEVVLHKKSIFSIS